MPLHDWTNPAGWDGVHNIWLVELLRWIKPRLPEGYRAYLGSVPSLTIGALDHRPDVGVREWPREPLGEAEPPPPSPEGTADLREPDEEIATLTLDPQTALYVVSPGRLVAAVALISPRNKDRPSARAAYLARYLNYLNEGVHLLLIDVHRRPLAFSFADALAQELQIRQPPCPTAMAVSYRVGEPAATGGRMLGIWREPLTIGAPLPTVQLALSVHVRIAVALEPTYRQAAADVYLT